MSDDEGNDLLKWVLLILAFIGALVVLAFLLPFLWSAAGFLLKALIVVVMLYGIYRIARGFMSSDESTEEVPDSHLLEAENELDDLTNLEHDRELAEFKAKLDAEQGDD